MDQCFEYNTLKDLSIINNAFENIFCIVETCT